MTSLGIEQFFDTTARNRWPKRWLQLAVGSLALAGIFSIILVVARTPQLIQAVPSLKGLFGVSLVVHVDLSVLVWFLAITNMLWAVYRAKFIERPWPYFDAAAWWCMLVGMLLMALSPLTGEWETIKSNYVPVITNLAFFISLSLVAVSTLIGAVITLTVKPNWSKDAVIWQGIYWSAPITLAALLAFFVTAQGLPESFSGLVFYEHLFWGGGHILQFTYVQAMLVAWCVMATVLHIHIPHVKFLAVLFALGALITTSSIYPYMRFDMSSQEYLDFFTQQMWVAGGVAAGLMGLYIAYHWCKAGETTKEQGALRGCLRMSLMLFMVGGAFGMAINGPNVRIPAHYHGAIVAVTLALMGMAYAMLPSMGAKAVGNLKMARIQPYLYGMGQLLHVSGLAWSGGYGVLRKAVGDTGDGSWQVKAALGIMGLGGLLAIIGGLLFVIVMVKAFRCPKSPIGAKDVGA